MFLTRGETSVDYRKLVESIPVGKWEMLSNKLIDFILTSKNDEKMPSKLANMILHHWQHDVLKTDTGLIALLEAVLLLEPEKTINVFNELQIANVAEQIRKATGS